MKTLQYWLWLLVILLTVGDFSVSFQTSSESSNIVKVKTFEEIMREKRLRKQEIKEQARTSAEAKTSERQIFDGTLKRKAPSTVNLRSSGSSSPSPNTPDTTSTIHKLPVRKLTHLKSKTGSPLNSSITSDTTAADKTLKQGETESHSHSPSSSREVPDKKMSNASQLSPAEQARAAAQVPTDDTTLNSNHMTSPESSTDTKGTSPLMLLLIPIPTLRQPSLFSEQTCYTGQLLLQTSDFFKCDVSKKYSFLLFELCTHNWKQNRALVCDESSAVAQ